MTDYKLTQLPSANPFDGTELLYVVQDGLSKKTLAANVAGGVYVGASPTNVTVGALLSGSNIAGLTPNAIIELMTNTYLSPTFASFGITGQATTVEVGTTLSGSKSFAWSFTNSGNVAPMTMDIIDVSGGTTLASNISNTSPSTQSIGSIQLNSPGSYSWRGSADNTNGATFNSSNFTVSWRWMRYVGTSVNTTLTENQIEALSSAALASTFSGSYALAAGGYKYFCWPDSFGSPTAVTGFKDSSTNFPMAMATSADNAAYSNTQNGWSYAIVGVTNVNGATTNYRVYRTQNVLGGTITVVVS